MPTFIDRNPIAEPLIRSASIILAVEIPFTFSAGAEAHVRLPALVTGICNRVAGLARWMGLSVSADWPALRDAAAALKVEAALTERGWTRGSRRQGRAIGVTAFEGQARFSGDLACLLPLLALGEITHAGAHAALGLGRCRLEPG